MPEKNLLRPHITKLGLKTLTPDGEKWLIKALHPADESYTGTQCPDGTAYNTVAVEYPITVTANASSLSVAPATPWGASLTLMPHPTCPVSLQFTGGAAAANPWTVRVPAFAGATVNDDFWNLAAIAEAWRLTFCSVTVHLDANSTKDSGIVHAAQQVMRPQVYNFSSTTAGNGHAPVTVYQVGDAPTASTIGALTRGYRNNLREGLYMPLKLSNTTQHWFSQREMHGMTTANMVATTGGPNYVVTLQPSAAAPAFNWPIPGLTPCSTTPGGDIAGGVTSAFLGDNFGFAFFDNIDPGSGLVIKVRLGLELRVRAASTLANLTQPPAAVDSPAIRSYFSVSRELQDAWPAAYNDASKILGVISQVIKTIAPALELLPVVGPVAGMLAGPVAAGFSKASKQAAKRKKQKRVEAAGQVVLRKKLAKMPALVSRR